MHKAFNLNSINNWPTYFTTGSMPSEVVGSKMREKQTLKMNDIIYQWACTPHKFNLRYTNTWSYKQYINKYMRLD